MNDTISRQDVDLVQGTDGSDRKFGYVHGEDGGFFFTWKDTIEATLASIEEDEVDGDGGLDESDVAEFLESYLPKTRMGKRMWGSDEA